MLLVEATIVVVIRVEKQTVPLVSFNFNELFSGMSFDLYSIEEAASALFPARKNKSKTKRKDAIFKDFFTFAKIHFLVFYHLENSVC